MTILLASIILAAFLLPASSASAAASLKIYRSVGPGDIADLNTGAATVSISGSVATFSAPLPGKVGVGDVLQYDPGSGLVVAFISGRTSSTVFTVQSASGGAPVSAPAGTAVKVFRAYTSLADAIAGNENAGVDASVRNFDAWTGGNNLVSPDETWNIACYGDAQDTTTGITISGWTTSSTDYLKIYTPYLDSEVGASQRHAGVWDDTKYKLVAYADTDGTLLESPINTGSANVLIDGLQIFVDDLRPSGGTVSAIAAHNATGSVSISDNIIKADPINGWSSYAVVVTNAGAAGVYKVWNNIIYGFLEGGISFSGAGNTMYAYNDTVYGSNLSVGSADVCYGASGGTFVSVNNIAQACGTGFSGTFGSGSGYNLSNLTDAPGSNSATSTTLAFAGTEDYLLGASDTAAINHGEDLSADANNPFSADIRNAQRPVGLWDIGADEYGASPGFVQPTVTTQSASSVTQTTATLNGDIAATGGVGPTVRGFSWGTDSSLSGGDTATTTDAAGQPFGVGTFSTTTLAFACGSTYYARAYATNSVGTAFGSIVSFTTGSCPDTTPPVVADASPSGELVAGTTSTVISVKTEIGATCKYSTAANTEYASMTGTMTENAGVYSATVSGLANNSVDDYYIRCSDAAGNPTVADTNVHFSVAAASSGGGGGGGGGVSFVPSPAPAPSANPTPAAQPAATTSVASEPAATEKASGLTEAQIQSILSVLESFSVDQATLADVTAALRGGSAASGGTAQSAPAQVATLYSFARDLHLGMSGADVKQLQQFLNGHGFAVSVSGPGSDGNETAYFGQATKNALAKFQAANGITPSAGYFGSMTRAAVSR